MTLTSTSRTNMDPVVAIELGSHYAQVGILQNGSFLIFKDKNGTTKILSCVAFTDGEVLVGPSAIDESAHSPRNTFCDIRQLLGRKFHDPDFQREIKSLPYDVEERLSKVALRVTIDGQSKWVAPEEILAELLKHLKATAEQFLGRTVKDVVVSAPDYFSSEQRQSIKDAGLLAGINILRIINESTAASLAYDVQNWKDEEGKRYEGFFLVYHIGTKCSYVTVESVEEGVFEMLSTTRSRNFGGVNLDETVIEGASSMHSPRHLGLTENLPRDEMKTEATPLVESSSVDLESLMSDPHTGSSRENSYPPLSEEFTTANLEYVDIGAFKEVRRVVKQVLQEGKLGMGNIDGIILTGNPAHVEKIVPFFEAHFGAGKILRGICSEDTAIQGLMVQAEILSSGQRATDCLCSFTVAPLSLGIETIGERFIKVIARNTTTPARKSRTISTVKDHQSKIDLRIFQGERAMTGRNKHVGTLKINGVHAARKGIPQITVAFEHDDDRTLTVSAVNDSNGEIVQLVIVLHNTRDEIEERILDQEAHAKEDSDWINALKTTEENHDGEYESGAVLSE